MQEVNIETETITETETLTITITVIDTITVVTIIVIDTVVTITVTITESESESFPHHVRLYTTTKNKKGKKTSIGTRVHTTERRVQAGGPHNQHRWLARKQLESVGPRYKDRQSANVARL